MRVFKNESMYNQETQEWEEFYEIDGLRVDVDTFAEQAEIEELVTEDDEIDQDCQCCNCDNQCDEFNCTCGEDTDVENDNVDDLLEDDNCEPCDCVDCRSARGEFTEDEEIEIGLVEHYAQYIEEIECTCGSELRNILYSLVQECMSMGYENAKEELDDNTVNISIDNLTINSTGNVDDFVNQFKQYLAKISR